jgi:hypothetical protein
VADCSRARDPAAMPIDFVAFTADRRISGRIMLADDRLSDMLNAVPRIVIRDAQVDELTENLAPRVADVTIAIGELYVVVGSGPRGSETLRRKSRKRRASIGLGRFVVEGDLVYPSEGGLTESRDPSVVLASRDLLVAITDATISYDRADGRVTESCETVLINRARAAWIDLEPAVFIDPYASEEDEDEANARTRYMKDFTNSIAE